MTDRSLILLIDRNRRNLELLDHFLGQAGYVTHAVSDLAEIDSSLSVDAGTIALALVDISGYDASIWPVCERLREEGIPLLVLSPRHSAAIRQESLVHGARSVLVKPLVARELMGLVKTLIDPEP